MSGPHALPRGNDDFAVTSQHVGEKENRVLSK